MSLSPYSVVVFSQQTGNVIPNASIEIKNRNADGTSGTYAAIYEDPEGNTPITQPGASANSRGTLVFYSSSGALNAEYFVDGSTFIQPVDVGFTTSAANNKFGRKPYNSLTDAINDTSLKVGDAVSTLGRNSEGDGGHADYIVVTGGTGANDGGSHLDTVHGLQLKLIGDQNVDIRVFGAVADWDGTTGTDNTQAIVSCVNYAKSTIIPKGYDFAVGENGSCFWQGISNKKIYGGGTLHKTGSKGIFSFKQCEDIEVHHINFDGQITADEAANGDIITGNRAPTNYAFAVSFAECKRCTARNNFVYDFAWDGLVAQGVVDAGGATATQSTEITFYKNRLTKVRGSQLWIKAVSGFDISRNKGFNPTDFNQKANMIFVVEWCDEGIVSHNRGYYIGDNFVGVGEMLSDTPQARNKRIQIHDNIVDITRYHSILIAQGEDIDVHNNTITNAAYKDNMTGGASAVLSAGITVLGGSSATVSAPRNARVNVTNNKIHNSRELGIYLFDRDQTSFNDSSSELVVTGNTITNSGRDVLATRIASGGILSQIQKPVTIKHNTIEFSLGDGIRVFGDAVIQGNTSNLNSGRGILVPNDTIWGVTKLSGTISNNVCNGNGGTGIEMASHSDGVFESNECTNNGFGSAPAAENGANAILHSGIGLQSVTRVSLSGNICNDNGASGIATYLCFIVDQSINHTSNNGGNFTVDNFKSGTYMEGNSGTGVDSTVFMGKGDSGVNQKYAIRILHNNGAVALDCKYPNHPLGIVGAVQKSSFNIP